MTVLVFLIFVDIIFEKQTPKVVYGVEKNPKIMSDRAALENKKFFWKWKVFL